MRARWLVAAAGALLMAAAAYAYSQSPEAKLRRYESSIAQVQDEFDRTVEESERMQREYDATITEIASRHDRLRKIVCDKKLADDPDSDPEECRDEKELPPDTEPAKETQ